MRQTLDERRDLLQSCVTSVVKQHVHGTDAIEEALPESRVGLIANVNLEPFLLKGSRLLVEVDSDDPNTIPKESPPHF